MPLVVFKYIALDDGGPHTCSRMRTRPILLRRSLFQGRGAQRTAARSQVSQSLLAASFACLELLQSPLAASLARLELLLHLR